MTNVWDCLFYRSIVHGQQLGHCRSVLNFFWGLCTKLPWMYHCQARRNFEKVRQWILCPTFATSFKSLSIYLKATTLTKVLCALGDIHGRLESRCFAPETKAQRFSNCVIWGFADRFSSHCIQWSKRSFARSWFCQQGARDKSWQRR